MICDISISEMIGERSSEIFVNPGSLEEFNLIFSQFFERRSCKRSFVTMNIASEFLNGTVQMVILQGELNYLKLDLRVEKQFQFPLRRIPSNQIHFFFNCRGDVKIVKNEALDHVPRLRLAALLSTRADDLQIVFKPKESYQCTILSFLEGEQTGIILIERTYIKIFTLSYPAIPASQIMYVTMI